MRNYTYIGVFKSDNGHEYESSVNCNGHIQALILLTADAIRSAKHYQLYSIVDEDGNIRKIGDIQQIGELIN